MIAFLMLVAIESPRVSEPKHVDVVEFNTVFNRDGTVQLRQIIVRRWGRYQNVHTHWVSEWTLMDSITVWQLTNGRLSIRWTHKGDRYHVIARTFVETKTLEDPEIIERDLRPQADREPYGIGAITL